MKRKQMYEQPRTEVVELRVTNRLLAGSAAGSMSDREDYTDGGDPFNPTP